MLKVRGDKHVVEWSGLVLPLRLDPKDRDGWQAAMLARRMKYCRLIRRVIRGRVRWFVQLVLEGSPFVNLPALKGRASGVKRLVEGR